MITQVELAEFWLQPVICPVELGCQSIHLLLYLSLFSDEIARDTCQMDWNSSSGVACYCSLRNSHARVDLSL